MEPAALQAAGFADREEPLDGAVPVVRLGAVAGLAPQHAVTQRALGGVVRGRDARDAGEGPERVVAIQQPCAEPGGLRVAAAGALLEQFVQQLTMGRELGCESVQVGHVAAWSLEDLECVIETLLELAAEPAGRAGALAERDEVTQNVSEAQLPLGRGCQFFRVS